MLGLVAVVLIVSVSLLAGQLKNGFGRVTTAVDSAVASSSPIMKNNNQGNGFSGQGNAGNGNTGNNGNGNNGNGNGNTGPSNGNGNGNKNGNGKK